MRFSQCGNGSGTAAPPPPATRFCTPTALTSKRSIVCSPLPLAAGRHRACTPAASICRGPDHPHTFPSPAAKRSRRSRRASARGHQKALVSPACRSSGSVSFAPKSSIALAPAPAHDHRRSCSNFPCGVSWPSCTVPPAALLLMTCRGRSTHTLAQRNEARPSEPGDATKGLTSKAPPCHGTACHRPWLVTPPTETACSGSDQFEDGMRRAIMGEVSPAASRGMQSVPG